MTAYTISGLVASKVLAKVSFFAIILKFWKLNILTLGGHQALFWLWYHRGLSSPQRRYAVGRSESPPSFGQAGFFLQLSEAAQLTGDEAWPLGTNY